MRVGNDKDYRNTDTCPVLAEVAFKKNDLEDKIRKEHKRAKIMYTYVRNKQGAYFGPFSKIYNDKCAYCGVLIGIKDICMFEVDHFICESSFSNDIKGRSEAGRVNNLVLSCYSCNRGKGNLLIEGAYKKILNPDDGSIAKVFVRDEDYYIRIQSDYVGDSVIEDFYKELTLGSELRRLDYLLLEMRNLISVHRLDNPDIAEKLEQCFCSLIMKRNKTLI